MYKMVVQRYIHPRHTIVYIMLPCPPRGPRTEANLLGWGKLMYTMVVRGCIYLCTTILYINLRQLRQHCCVAGLAPAYQQATGQPRSITQQWAHSWRKLMYKMVVQRYIHPRPTKIYISLPCPRAWASVRGLGRGWAH